MGQHDEMLRNQFGRGKWDLNNHVITIKFQIKSDFYHQHHDLKVKFMDLI